MKFYKRDPDAALVGMTGLTLPERGAYNTIIDLLYSHDGVLPDNDEILRQACGCHGNEWRSLKVKLILKGKIWITEDGYLKAKRVDSTIEEAASFSEVQRKRVGKRWETERKRLGKVCHNDLESAAKTEKYEQLQNGGDTSAVLPSIAIATPTSIKKERKEAPRANAHRGPHLIPNDWLPTEGHSNLAGQLGLSTEQLDSAACEMRDWSKGAGKKRTDWNATFNNWLRRNAQKNYNGRSMTAKDATYHALQQARRSIADNPVDQFLSDGSDQRPTDVPRIRGSGSH